MKTRNKIGKKDKNKIFNWRSRSIPMETKKKLVKTSLNGMRLPKALWLYSDSEIISPARKAPKASDMPSSWVSMATARQISSRLIRKSS